MAIAATLTAILLAQSSLPKQANAMTAEVSVSGPTVTIGDLFSLENLSPESRASIGGIALIKLPPKGDRFELGQLDAWKKAVRLVPALASADGPRHDGRIVVKREASASVPKGPCLELIKPIKEGAYPLAQDVQATHCPDGPLQPAFSYKARLAVVRASRDLAEGEVVLAPPAGSLALMGPGQPLFLETRVGAVILQRQATTLRPLRPDADVLVKTVDGAVFAAPLQGNLR